MTGTAGAKSVAKSTDNWRAPESIHQSKTQEGTISQTHLTSPLVSRGRKCMPRAQAETTGCSAQAPRGCTGCTMSPFAKQGGQSPRVPIGPVALIQAMLPVSNPDRAFSQ